MGTIAIYPGSFDPVTNGHLDMIERGLKLFDRIIVAILINLDKDSLFSLEERTEMLEISLKRFSNIEVDTFDGLLVDYAAKRNVHAILRGLRALSDFEYEFQLAAMNRRLMGNIETVFLTPAENYTFLSATMVKEVARLGGDISSFVHPTVAKVLQERYPSRS